MKDLYSENYKTLMKEIKDDKQIEKYTMFLDWKNQYCENEYTIQSNLQTQYNPYQSTNGIFHRISTKNFTIRLETQKTPNSQSNPEKEKRIWRNISPHFFLACEISVEKSTCRLMGGSLV